MNVYQMVADEARHDWLNQRDLYCDARDHDDESDDYDAYLDAQSKIDADEDWAWIGTLSS